jgi:hypothetical protein
MNFQKTYMSRAITRAMAADHPIGDPFGGVAFGERNDPVSAVISIGTMFATGSAMMAGSVMAGIAFAGAAVSLVGNITGNKTLMQIGAVAGIVGGLGSMGAFGEAAKGATWSSLGGTTAAPVSAATPLVESAAPAASTTPWGGTTAPTPMDVGVTSAVPSPAPGSLTPTPLNAPSTAPVTNAQGVTSTAGNNLFAGSPAGSATAATGNATAASNLGNATEALDEIVPASALGSQNTAFGTNIEASGVAGGTAPAIQPQSMFEKAMGYGKSAMDFAKDNPMGAYMIGKSVGGVTDWLSGKTDAELEMLKAAAASKRAEEQLYGVRADQLRYEIEREKQRRANLNAGYQQVNAGVAVNPGVNIQQPWGQQPAPGLINSARTA